MAKEFNRDQIALIAQGKLHELYKLGTPGIDAVSLYMFYYYTSNWQHTRRPKAVKEYCMKHFAWGNRRFYKAKKVLLEKGLIVDVQNNTKGAFSEAYIELPFKATESTAAGVVEHLLTAGVPERPAVSNTTNTPNVDKLNTPNVDTFTKQENYEDEDTYANEENLAPRLDNSSWSKNVPIFEKVTSPKLTEEEIQLIYDKVTTANEDFDAILGDPDSGIYEEQRLKTALHLESTGRIIKTRPQFIAAIALYTLNGGPAKLNEAYESYY